MTKLDSGNVEGYIAKWREFLDEDPEKLYP
jgi:hypothetical protein